MLQSDCKTPQATAAEQESRPPERKESFNEIGSLMSSFTIKTPKPWTMVVGFEEPLAKTAGKGRRSRQASMPADKRPIRAAAEAVPYAMGARRASATGDREWIEAYGLIPNHNFRPTKIIQHIPPSMSGAKKAEKEQSPIRHAPTAIQKRRSSEAHAQSSSSVGPIGDETVQKVSKRSLTFHCLEYENGAMRPASQRGEGGKPGRQNSSAGTTFVPSEYQPKVRNSRDVLPVATPKIASPEASLEAAQTLLDFTRIFHA